MTENQRFRGLAVAVLMGAAAVISFGTASSASAAPPAPIDDSIPVTDPRAYLPENVERLTMFGTDYCVPRLSSMRLHQPKDGRQSNGGSVTVDVLTLTSTGPFFFPKRSEKVDYTRHIVIDVTPSSPDWGFNGVFKLHTGKLPGEVDDGEWLSLDGVKSLLAEARRNPAGPFQIHFLMRVENKTAFVYWHRGGQLRALYEVAPGIVGSVTLAETYVDRLPLLIQVASNVFRPCANAR